MTREHFRRLAPPWIIFSDEGKSVAILPAGRPGEVANVEALPDETVEAIVQAANVNAGVDLRLRVLATRLAAREALGAMQAVLKSKRLNKREEARLRDSVQQITELLTYDEMATIEDDHE